MLPFSASPPLPEQLLRAVTSCEHGHPRRPDKDLGFHSAENMTSPPLPPLSHRSRLFSLLHTSCTHLPLIHPPPPPPLQTISFLNYDITSGDVVAVPPSAPRWQPWLMGCCVFSWRRRCAPQCWDEVILLGKKEKNRRLICILIHSFISATLNPSRSLVILYDRSSEQWKAVINLQSARCRTERHHVDLNMTRLRFNLKGV